MHKNRTTLLIHLTGWITWLTLISLNAIIKWIHVPFWPQVWNFASVILVFYASLLCGKIYCNNLSFMRGAQLRKRKLIMYLLFRWPVALFLTVPVMYIMGHWWLDKFFFNTMQYQFYRNDFLSYADWKFSRAGLYWLSGGGLAVAQFIIKKKNHLLQMHRKREQQYRDYINQKHQQNLKVLEQMKRQMRGL